MFNKTFTDWFDSFDDEQPTADGAWANAWAPVFDRETARRAETAHQAVTTRPVATAHEAQADRWMGGALNHG